MEKFGSIIGLSNTDPRSAISNLIKVAMSFVGIILVIMILAAGFRFMISGGDKEKTAKAKSAFFNAIIGIVIMLMAYSIVLFVFRALGVAGAETLTQ